MTVGVGGYRAEMSRCLGVCRARIAKHGTAGWFGLVGRAVRDRLASSFKIELAASVTVVERVL